MTSTPTHICKHCGKGIWLAIKGQWLCQTSNPDSGGYGTCFKAPVRLRYYEHMGLHTNVQEHEPDIAPIDNPEALERWLNT